MDICGARQSSTLHGLVQEAYVKHVFKEVCWEEEHYMDIWYLRLIFFERRYLWIPPKFYITRTCPRGGHGADATNHSAVGLDQATGRPDKTEHALLAFQKA